MNTNCCPLLSIAKILVQLCSCSTCSETINVVLVFVFINKVWSGFLWLAFQGINTSQLTDGQHNRSKYNHLCTTQSTDMKCLGASLWATISFNASPKPSTSSSALTIQQQRHSKEALVIRPVPCHCMTKRVALIQNDCLPFWWYKCACHFNNVVAFPGPQILLLFTMSICQF